MNWKLLIASCMLTAGLLFNIGAPPLSVAVGLGVGALITWRRQRSLFPGWRKP